MNSENPSVKMVFCKDCKITFSKTSNLRAHVKRKHPDKLEELAPLKKKTYNCPFCGEQYEVLKHFVLHKKKHRSLNELKCPLCHYTGTGRNNIITHYRIDHSFTIDTESLQFNSFEDFQLWKSKVEEDSFALFTMRNGSIKKPNYTKNIYTCHRSGEFKSKSKNIRRLKRQGSNKINGFCPARMDLTIRENQCELKFCKTHVGHGQKQDLVHLILSKAQKQNLAAKIAEEIPFQTILDQVRDSVSNSHLERLHLLTKKDLHNIKQCFKLDDSSEQHSNDDINDLVINTDNESTALVTAVSSTRIVDNNLQEEKKRFVEELCRELQENVTTINELEAVKRLIAPIKPTLNAMKCQQSDTTLTIPLESNHTPVNISIKKEQVITELTSSEESDLLNIEEQVITWTIPPESKHTPVNQNIKMEEVITELSSEESDLLNIKEQVIAWTTLPESKHVPVNRNIKMEQVIPELSHEVSDLLAEQVL